MKHRTILELKSDLNDALTALAIADAIESVASRELVENRRIEAANRADEVI